MLLTSLLIGAVLAAGVVAYWDKIKTWLNSVFVDAIERTLGYSARNTAQRAIAVVDRLVDKLRNTSVVYSKKSPTATYFDKTTIISEAGIYDVEEDMRKFLSENNNHVERTFTYDKNMQEFVYEN